MSSHVLHHLLHEETSLSSPRAARVLASTRRSSTRHGEMAGPGRPETTMTLNSEVVESVTLVFLWEVSVQMFFVFSYFY